MTKYEFLLTDSLEKVLPDRRPDLLELASPRLFKNQQWSFQLAYTCQNDDFGESSTCFWLRCTGSARKALKLFQVELVPCDYPCHGTWDDNYLTTRPGLLPDLLRPVEWDEPFKAVPAQWRSLWLTLDASALEPGRAAIELELVDSAGEQLAAFSLTVSVLNQALPPQTLFQTQWFHADCLADYYQVPVFSEEHWRILDNFMASAAEHGINMLLTPIFTPPLDTAKGGERTTVQLVDITLKDGEWSFQFDRLRRWVKMARSHGITEIELAHLFTQWGAEFAPKIFVYTSNGLEKRFGWHTPAVGGEYTCFLRAFLPALKQELDELVGLAHVWFHISDEPHDKERETYAAAKATVADLLQDCHVIDALSSYDIYQQGIVEKPVVCNDCIQKFVDNGVTHLWTYYCTVQAVAVPNRFIAMPSARNRIMGALLYQYNLEGFLHWGFNFYNSQRSVRHIDPFRVTDAGEAFPSGDAFLVYPGPDGSAWGSIRGEVLKQALQDLRLLQLCESRIGHSRTQELLRTVGGEMSFTNYPRDKTFFSRLWETVMALFEVVDDSRSV
ncbi:DUF4091 domain-containing protein [uncultured Ruthenibacterium sp.]|uniref:DUF4091 domain-containing protein n=1 Tax=uncultured Ruthenibacterium sp. TaxID=1905347 RepID=UPI00349EE614